jgi:hypothetical protein
VTTASIEPGSGDTMSSGVPGWVSSPRNQSPFAVKKVVMSTTISLAMMAGLDVIARRGKAWSIAWRALATAMSVAPELFAWVVLLRPRVSHGYAWRSYAKRAAVGRSAPTTAVPSLPQSRLEIDACPSPRLASQ